jgi:heat shock protein HslJ
MLKAFLILATVLLLAACSAAAGSAPPSDPPGASGSPVAADPAGPWQLTAGTVDGKPLVIPADRRVTFIVDGTTVGGQSACNQYFGEFAVVEGRVTLTGLGGTEMACDEPTMLLEGAYLKGLAAVQAAAVAGDSLVLSGPGVELSFERLQPPPTAEIVGTTWVLEALANGDAVSSTIGEQATLVLDADGTFTGSTGCRTVAGSYIVTGDQVTFNDWGADGECDPAVAGQDEQVIAALEGGFRAAVEGQQLTLTADDGTGLIYRAGAAG